ncbi:hypothetical protein FOL47_003959 [Perkinsus chesapeaki]|uniref:Uncharacterized protein n=1 Tax=Perkinsus chesapeaki TaxID=330153 RepID=A0A7J6M5F7_PERCH|nr:hypothetical protein FOL47_003959 [Perkinsus chesapeaki]
MHNSRTAALAARSAIRPAQNAVVTSASRHFAGKTSPSGGQWQAVDGCTSTCHVSYAMTDTAFIFPITPSSPAAELAEQWLAKDKAYHMNTAEFTKNIQAPIALLKGDDIPVSAFASDELVGGPGGRYG